jgi:flagellar biosynthesis protein FliQ
MIPVYEPAFDLRVLVSNLKAGLGIDEFSLSQVPHILQSAPSVGLIARHISELPELPN